FYKSKRSQRNSLMARKKSVFPSFPSRPSVNIFEASSILDPPSSAEIPRSAFRAPRFWQQSLSTLLIVALVLATTETNVQAQVYDPVFYYYHSDHLGSSNILVDRAGNIVQQYEYTAYR